MPPVIIAVVAGGIAVTAGATLLTAASIALSAYSIVTSLSASRISGAAPYSQEIKDRKIMLRSSNQTRKIIYGEAKVSGPLAFAGVTGEENEFLHLVIPLAAHEVNQIGDVSFNDELSTYYDQFTTLQKEKIYYDVTGSNFKVTINLNGVINSFTEDSPEDVATSITALSGVTATTEAAGTAGTRVIILADTPSDSFTLSDTIFDNLPFSVTTEARIEKLETSNAVYRISKHLGADNQTADADLVSEVSQWTTAHRLRGIAYLYVRLTWKEDVWMNGIPNISAIVQGKKVFDYRDLTTSYTNNWALCVADYLSSTDGFGASSTELDSASIIAAANISDEQVQVTTAPDTYQNRYELNGVVRLDASPRRNLDAMIGAGAGTVTYTQGVFKVDAGAYSAPVKTITIEELAGAIKMRAKGSRAQTFNAVKGIFADPTQFYEPTDFPPVTNSLYETEDGEQIFGDIELGYTTDSTMAQRLAKIMLEKTRQGITLNLPLNLSGLELAVNDTVRVNVELLGWDFEDASTYLHMVDGVTPLHLEDGITPIHMEIAAGKLFRITQWELTSKGSVNLVLVEEASGIYDWNMGNETTVDLAPNTTLPSAFSVSPPSSLNALSGDNELLVNTDGTVISRMFVSWTSPDAFIVEYSIGWKKATDANWITMKTIQTELFISGIEDGELYDIKVSATNAAGVSSPFTEITHTVIGKLAPPPDVDSFFVKAQGDGTREFTWSQASPALDHAGYEIRYKSGAGGTWSTMTAIHSGLLLASPFESNQLAAGSYTFGIKAIDTSGNESTNAKIVEFTLPDPRIIGALDFVDFREAGWPGTLTNCWKSDDGDLHAEDQKDWSDFATDTDTWADWLEWARNPYDNITYEHPAIDVGTITKFIPLVSVYSDSTEVTTEINLSDDDITYAGWTTLTSSEVEARYIKIRVKVEDTTPPTEINKVTIENISIILSAKPLSEDIEDLDISTLTGANRIAVGHVKIPIQVSYVIIKRVDVVLQNVGSGWTWELIAKSDLTNGPEIKVYNGGALADATIDATIRGL